MNREWVYQVRVEAGESPEDVVKAARGHTARFLEPYLSSKIKAQPKPRGAPGPCESVRDKS